MIGKAIQQLIEYQDLSREAAFETMETIMNGAATPAQIGAFLVAMCMKGEKSSEISGFAASMRKQATPVTARLAAAPIDLVGTGGDGKNTFNITTAAAFVAAGAGIPVAKHGNRSVSSQCGSADVLRALGIRIDLDAVQMGLCLEEAGIAFLFAPVLHPAMKNVLKPRREIGIRSVFNILGPLTNPAGVTRQLIGVYDRRLAGVFAEVLNELGAEHVLIVHSVDGMDEISIAEPTWVVELHNGSIREYQVSPDTFGLKASTIALSGGDAPTNAGMIKDILEGQKGPARDIVVANAAAGLRVSGITGNLAEGARIAEDSIDSGKALKKLAALQKISNSWNHLSTGVA